MPLPRLLLFAGLFLSLTANAQTAADYAIQLQATTQVSPPQVRLQWRKPAGPTGYTVARKARSAAAWQTLGTVTDSFYTDNNVAADSAYEYAVTGQGGTFTPTGYVYAGVRAPAVHSNGAMILLVDSTFTDSCRAPIAQLMADLRGDGWAVIRHDVSRNAAVPAIKSLIVSDYNAHPGTKGVLLLGHIPVPYSGQQNPDGHPDHLGAWPADVYYGDVDGAWTDLYVDDTSASRTQNRNRPGDGKWDQVTPPSAVELMTGRIDFANMPAIGRTEMALMRSYLDKAHRYKMDSLALIRKAVVDDNFGAFSGEAFAANAWRGFAPVLGSANIRPLDFINTLKDSAYQWAYGCGSGSYTSAGGIGTTTDFATKPVKGIFTMLFGSYFGDWDAANCFLRAPLCAPEPALTSAWVGRPNWFVHPMALGEPIGASLRDAQNNSGLYNPTNYGARYVHLSLMGDPSLRTQYIRPPAGLTITPVPAHGATIAWSPSPDPGVIGYYVYRCDSAYGFYKLRSALLTATTFNDTVGTNGIRHYLVRPVVLQATPSGSYYNLGVGIGDSALVSFPFPAGIAGVTGAPEQLTLYPNPARTELNVVMELPSAAAGRLRILDATGRVLREQSCALRQGRNTVRLEVGLLPAGLYQVHLQTAGRSASGSWVKAGT